MVALPWLPAQAGAQSVSQPSVPDCCLLLANDGKQLTPKSASNNQVRRTDGVFTNASLERPPGRAPGIEEPRLWHAARGSQGSVQKTSWAGPGRMRNSPRLATVCEGSSKPKP